MKILVTGAHGFIGKNICLYLKNNQQEPLEYDLDTKESLESLIKEAECVIHLAGINRPLTKEEFYDGNANFTKKLVDSVKENGKNIPIIFASSIQAELDNDYGKSKKMAEDYLFASGLPVFVYRLANVFGKWCRPNYNSVVATFCNNIARNEPITINNRETLLRFNYIDDICEEFYKLITKKIKRNSSSILSIKPVHKCTLGELADLLYSFKEQRTSNFVPNMKTEFAKKLYATYLSYLPENEFSYPLNMHVDNRGSFTEFLKTNHHGQVSVNISKPGITKGNHYHNTKNEKFLVVSGTCSIKFRKIGTTEVIEYITSGEKLEVVDIPTGYTHNITNIGETDSVTIMWANEAFDSKNPDTYFEIV